MSGTSLSRGDGDEIVPYLRILLAALKEIQLGPLPGSNHETGTHPPPPPPPSPPPPSAASTPPSAASTTPDSARCRLPPQLPLGLEPLGLAPTPASPHCVLATHRLDTLYFQSSSGDSPDLSLPTSSLSHPSSVLNYGYDAPCGSAVALAEAQKTGDANTVIDNLS
ncbi:hypothetical protein B0H11DRAFT_2289671 [Mycena galericulata]|nr:hypothetical protein B0H11DRAFT_2289671 [Mycena galericulata]